MKGRCGHLHASIVLRPTDFERSIDEDDTIKGHGSCCIFCTTELNKGNANVNQLFYVKGLDLTYLDEGVVLFVVALYGQNRGTRRSRSNIHLDHLAVEEVGKVLFSDIRGDAANIQTTGLAREVRVNTHPHTEGLNRHGRGQTGSTQDRRNLGTIRAGQIEQACTQEMMVSTN